MSTEGRLMGDWFVIELWMHGSGGLNLVAARKKGSPYES